MDEACRDLRVVHIIGHSTRTIETFCALLEVHAIDRVVDGDQRGALLGGGVRGDHDLLRPLAFVQGPGH
jgi:hypothetical protein